MRVYQFTVIVPELDDAGADAIYAACSDASVGASHGVPHVAFDRAADNLEQAIQSAVTDLRRVGVEPRRIELDVAAVVGS